MSYSHALESASKLGYLWVELFCLLVAMACDRVINNQAKATVCD